MARIRTIKPTITQSETLGAVSRNARLLFIFMITQADDHGRLRGNPAMLRSTLFPYDSLSACSVEEWLAELSYVGAITQYICACGDRYVQISTWTKHQKIDRPKDSQIPALDNNSTIVRRFVDDSSSIDRRHDPVGREGNGMEGKGLYIAHSSSELDIPPLVADPNIVTTSPPPPPPSKRVPTAELELAYAGYPRKEGKSRGFKILERQIKTADDLRDLLQAVERFRLRMEAQEREKKHIMRFDTWVGEWRDWVNAEIEKSPEQEYLDAVADLVNSDG